MMLCIFLFVTLAFCLELMGRWRLAVSSLAVSLALTVWLFLFEIHNPAYGFKMPWLKVEHTPSAQAKGA